MTFEDRHPADSRTELLRYTSPKPKRETWGEILGGGKGTPSPKPTITNAEAERTEDKVDLSKASEDWLEGEAHGGEEGETQDQGQHHEAHAHMDEN